MHILSLTSLRRAPLLVAPRFLFIGQQTAPSAWSRQTSSTPGTTRESSPPAVLACISHPSSHDHTKSGTVLPSCVILIACSHVMNQVPAPASATGGLRGWPDQRPCHSLLAGCGECHCGSDPDPRHTGCDDWDSRRHVHDPWHYSSRDDRIQHREFLSRLPQHMHPEARLAAAPQRGLPPMRGCAPLDPLERDPLCSRTVGHVVPKRVRDLLINQNAIQPLHLFYFPKGSWWDRDQS